jgi:hypothetical protein
MSCLIISTSLYILMLQYPIIYVNTMYVRCRSFFLLLNPEKLQNKVVTYHKIIREPIDASLNLRKPPRSICFQFKTGSPGFREIKRKRLQKIASRLYTKNLTESPDKLVRRHLWPIVAASFPGRLFPTSHFLKYF